MDFILYFNTIDIFAVDLNSTSHAFYKGEKYNPQLNYQTKYDIFSDLQR